MKKIILPIIVFAVLFGIFAKIPVMAVEKFNGLNGIKIMENLAIAKGVDSSMMSVLLLLPLVATIVSVLHYVVGLTGYGIFIPTMIAVTFLSMGIVGGLVLFGLILGVSLLSNAILKKLKLHFWPARAINLVLIGLGVMVLSIFFGKINGISIYSVMIMILLVEEFVRTQLVKSKNEARNLTIGTLFLSSLGAGIMSIHGLRAWVLNNPDVSVFLMIIVNIVVGNYKGIRWTEISRFSKAIRK